MYSILFGSVHASTRSHILRWSTLSKWGNHDLPVSMGVAMLSREKLGVDRPAEYGKSMWVMYIIYITHPYKLCDKEC